MSRATRTVRGVIGASIATVLAAASHSLGGGEISFIAVLTTTIFVLPLCVALAGRIGSIWRLGVAVTVSQFFYHWIFAGMGAGIATALSTSGGSFAASHASHLARLEHFVPAIAEAGAADLTMWIMHACAAAVTITALGRGERAVLSLLRLVRQALPLRPVFTLPVLPTRRALPVVTAPARTRADFLSCMPLTRRGPPVAA